MGRMAAGLTGIRHTLQQVTESVHAVKRLTDTGIIDLKDLKSTVRAGELAPVYGPQATMAVQGGH